MLARTPGGAMTCDGRTDQNVPSPRGVHPIQTRASWRVFPRTPAAKAKMPGYASSERQASEKAPARRPGQELAGDRRDGTSPTRLPDCDFEAVIGPDTTLAGQDTTQSAHPPTRKVRAQSTPAVNSGATRGKASEAGRPIGPRRPGIQSHRAVTRSVSGRITSVPLVGRLVFLNDRCRNAAPLADLLAALSGPLANFRAPLAARTAARLAARPRHSAGPPGVSNVAAEDVVQFLRMGGADIDLVTSAVNGEGNCLGPANLFIVG